LIHELKGKGFSVKLDTNGSNPQILEPLVKNREIDFVSMDVKAPLDPFSYRRSIGVSIDLDLILRSIKLLKREEVEFRGSMEKKISRGLVKSSGRAVGSFFRTSTLKILWTPPCKTSLLMIQRC
jgi:hypothetical protein